MGKKTYYYHKDQSDDFGTLGRNGLPLKDNFVYIHRNIFYRIFSFILFYFIAFPILFVVSKIMLGVQVKGKREIKKQLKKKEGFFLYSNHCHYYDAFISHVCIGIPRRTYVISHSDPMNIPFLHILISMLGCFPLPSTFSQYKLFSQAIHEKIQAGSMITIYPEGTLWPYYNGLRPMPKASFKYPAMNHAPIVLCAETWRKPKILKFLKPRLTLTLSSVIRPDEKKSVQENTDYFFLEAEKFFKETVLVPDNVSYHTYLPLEEKE